MHFHLFLDARIFFKASTKSSIAQIGQLVCYERVRSSQESGINIASGIFTAPISGYYAFHLAIQFRPGFNNAAIMGIHSCANCNHRQMIRQLAAVCYCAHEKDYNCIEAKSRTFTFTHLKSGDRVGGFLLEGSIGACKFRETSVTFTGVLISADS